MDIVSLKTKRIFLEMFEFGRGTNHQHGKKNYEQKLPIVHLNSIKLNKGNLLLFGSDLMTMGAEYH